ncbi:3493_t:CDS:1, partial [Gigaspora rosea]
MSTRIYPKQMFKPEVLYKAPVLKTKVVHCMHGFESKPETSEPE